MAEGNREDSFPEWYILSFFIHWLRECVFARKDENELAGGLGILFCTGWVWKNGGITQ